MSTDEWKSVLGMLAELGVNNFAFTGGEPLLRGDLFEIIEYATELSCAYYTSDEGKLRTFTAPPSLFLISNAKLVNEEVIANCRKHKVHLSMSLPGLSTLEYHSGGCGHAEDILDKFRKAAAAGLSTTVNITVTKKNLFELYDTVSAALLAGAESLLINRFLPGGRGLKYMSELALNIDETNQMLDIAEEVLSRANRQGTVGTELPHCILRRHDYSHLNVGTECGAAKTFFVVGPSGNIRTCNHSPRDLVHVSRWKELRQHPYWKSFVFRDYHPAMCNACELIHRCDGGCREAAHVLNGSPSDKDLLFCDPR
jgi:radical SAM protein with 4Fe4S-binding SPASM domain